MAINNSRDTRATDKPQKSATRRTLRFMFNPEFGRSAASIGNTFQMFVQMLALLFASNGTLERTHPFFQRGARFTMGDLFRETHERIEWNNRDKLPQTVFFCAVWGLLTSAILYLVTFVLLFVAAPSQAHAQTESAPAAASGSMFSVSNPASDLGLRLIDYIVLGKALPVYTGDPDKLADAGTMNGGINSGIIQRALRAMLQMYSSAILVIASFFLLYHIVMLLAKSAWSGKPLEGANAIWGPLRLVIAIGLLVPLSDGINSGQYMVLKIASTGSSLASNVWSSFIARIESSDSEPSTLPRNDVAQQFYDMILVNTCKHDINTQVQANGGSLTGFLSGAATGGVTGAILGAVGSYDEVFTIPNLTGIDTVYSIGPLLNGDLCGTITLPYTSEARETASNGATEPVADVAVTADSSLQTDEAKMGYAIRKEAAKPATTLYEASDKIAKDLAALYSKYDAGEQPPTATTDSISKEAGEALKAYYTSMENVYSTVVATEVQKYRSSLAAKLRDNNQGWVMAGAHFMRISSMQSNIANAVNVIPAVERGEIFGRVSKKAQGDAELNNASKNSNHEHFLSQLENKTGGYGPAIKRIILCGIGAQNCGGNSAAVGVPPEYKNLISIRQVDSVGLQYKEASAPTGALAWLGSLVSVDKAKFLKFVQPSINDPFGTLFSLGHFVFWVGLTLMVPGLLIPAGAALFAIGTWALTMAVMLAFILPLIPMIKFLSAIVAWIFGVLEAVIGIPLFALAHLTPGGDGLLDPVRQGYSMLLHIALQPVFLIFGMIAAILMASVSLYMLNIMYVTALNAVWGSGDVFILIAVAFMGVYCLNAYALCNACFKFIDDIGQSSMKWFGGQAYGFKDVDGQGIAHKGLLISQGLEQLGKTREGVHGALKNRREAAAERYKNSESGMREAAKKAALADLYKKEAADELNPTNSGEDDPPPSPYVSPSGPKGPDKGGPGGAAADYLKSGLTPDGFKENDRMGSLATPTLGANYSNLPPVGGKASNPLSAPVLNDKQKAEAAYAANAGTDLTRSLQGAASLGTGAAATAAAAKAGAVGGAVAGGVAGAVGGFVGAKLGSSTDGSYKEPTTRRATSGEGEQADLHTLGLASNATRSDIDAAYANRAAQHSYFAQNADTAEGRKIASDNMQNLDAARNRLVEGLNSREGAAGANNSIATGNAGGLAAGGSGIAGGANNTPDMSIKPGVTADQPSSVQGYNQTPSGVLMPETKMSEQWRGEAGISGITGRDTWTGEKVPMADLAPPPPGATMGQGVVVEDGDVGGTMQVAAVETSGGFQGSASDTSPAITESAAGSFSGSSDKNTPAASFGEAAPPPPSPIVQAASVTAAPNAPMFSGNYNQVGGGMASNSGAGTVPAAAPHATPSAASGERPASVFGMPIQPTSSVTNRPAAPVAAEAGPKIAKGDEAPSGQKIARGTGDAAPTQTIQTGRNVRTEPTIGRGNQPPGQGLPPKDKK